MPAAVYCTVTASEPLASYARPGHDDAAVLLEDEVGGSGLSRDRRLSVAAAERVVGGAAQGQPADHDAVGRGDEAGDEDPAVRLHGNGGGKTAGVPDGQGAVRVEAGVEVTRGGQPVDGGLAPRRGPADDDDRAVGRDRHVGEHLVRTAVDGHEAVASSEREVRCAVGEQSPHGAVVVLGRAPDHDDPPVRLLRSGSGGLVARTRAVQRTDPELTVLAAVGIEPEDERVPVRSGVDHHGPGAGGRVELGGNGHRGRHREDGREGGRHRQDADGSCEVLHDVSPVLSRGQ